MRIEKDMKLADVIHHDFSLVPVINRFGIHLGFGDGTIGEICEDKAVNTEFFLTILNTYHDAQYFPKKHLQSFHSATLIEYLRKAHQFYLEQKIPEIKNLICKLTEESGQNKNTYQLAVIFLRNMKKNSPDISTGRKRWFTLMYTNWKKQLKMVKHPRHFLTR